MTLNHINLTVSDVVAARDCLETYFGLRTQEGAPGDDRFAILIDDAGMVVTLMRVGQGTNVGYPPSFHIGFVQETEAQVDEMYARLTEAGFEINPPRRFHGSWTFYFRAPGGVTIEVLR